MSWFREFTRSSIGMKQLMAVTGLGLAVFVLAHMLGNLQVFGGRDMMNSYAASLQGMGPLLWIARAGLLLIFVVHVAAALRLIALNRGARQVKYRKLRRVGSSWYSHYMAMTGIVLLVYVVMHILNYTVGVIQPEAFQLYEAPSGEILAAPTDATRHDAYGMLVASLSNPLMAAWYLFAMALLCMHLAHGVTSFLQTLGANHPKYNKSFAILGPTYGWVVFLGFAAPVVAILAGVVK